MSAAAPTRSPSSNVVVAEMDLPDLDVDPQQPLGGRVPARPFGQHRARLEQHFRCRDPLQCPAILPFVHRLRVRYHECDRQGIVFNAQWFAYFDVTLTELWRAAFGSYDALVAEGSDVVVVDAQARFLAPARFDEELDLSYAIERLGTTR